MIGLCEVIFLLLEIDWDIDIVEDTDSHGSRSRDANTEKATKGSSLYSALKHPGKQIPSKRKEKDRNIHILVPVSMENFEDGAHEHLLSVNVNENIGFNGLEEKTKIQVKDLTRSLDKGVTILQNVRLDIPKGKIMGIIGPNGSGKSTLLRALNHLLEAPFGTVFLDGTDITGLDVLNLRRKVEMLSIHSSKVAYFYCATADPLLKEMFNSAKLIQNSINVHTNCIHGYESGHALPDFKKQLCGMKQSQLMAQTKSEITSHLILCSLDNLHSKLNAQIDHLQAFDGAHKSGAMTPTQFTLEDRNRIIRIKQSHASIATSLKKLSSDVGLLFSSSHAAEGEKTCKPISNNMERYWSEGEKVEGEQRKEKRKLTPSKDQIKIRKHTR
ncbi:hypothetical protein L6452_40545 [Arctium lappa]|uniref:Uncharacterized protein n=1 Tax=Arctium lappa TaxID=4217 RepID=A0ACB8XMK7_ARCLA|nr:hypothetical protein L6452_40545 [Arctium lappa]